MMRRRDLLKATVLLPFASSLALSPIKEVTQEDELVEAMIYSVNTIKHSPPMHRYEWKIYKARNIQELWDVYHDGQFYRDTVGKFPSIADDHLDPAKQGQIHSHIRIWFLNPKENLSELILRDKFHHKWPHVEWIKFFSGFKTNFNWGDMPNYLPESFAQSLEKESRWWE